MKLVTQEAPMGCAIACCASLVGLSYKQTRGYFSKAKTKEHTLGFYNRDILKALNRLKKEAQAFSIRKWGKRKIKPGQIVFIGRSAKFPQGHYLLKTRNGWMNPWINYPCIAPAKAGFQKRVPGEIRWVIKVF